MTKYTEQEVKRILKQEIGTSRVTEEKIQDAYAQIRRAAKVQEFAGKGERGRDRGKLPMRRLAVLAAAVCIVAAGSATALALGGYFEKTVTKEENKLTYQFEVNYELTPNTVEMKAGYIPEGYAQLSDGTLKWCADGSWQNGISLAVVNSATLARDASWMDMDYVLSVEEDTINEMEAHLITLEYDPERVSRTFDKRIYLFNPEDGYVGVVFGGNDLTMDELKKVAAGVSYTVTGEGEKLDAAAIAEEAQRETEIQEHWQEAYQELRALGVPKENTYEIGDTFNYLYDSAQNMIAAITDPADAQVVEDLKREQGMKMTVTGVEVLDAVTPELYDGFFCYEEDIAPMMEEDGSLKPYERVTFRQAETSGTAEEIARETVGQKFVKVTMTAENITDETQELWAGEAYLENLAPREDGGCDYLASWTEPLNWQEYGHAEQSAAAYFAPSPYENTDSHYFYRTLEPGETFAYTLIYLADEDRLDNLYLRFGWAEELYHGKLNRWYVKLR